jgi:hypothetical protein
LQWVLAQVPPHVTERTVIAPCTVGGHMDRNPIALEAVEESRDRHAGGFNCGAAL